MPKEFIIRGKTANAGEEIINMSGYRPGYGYQLLSFELWPSYNLGNVAWSSYASITADNTAGDPVNPDFINDGLIGTAAFIIHSGTPFAYFTNSCVNDLFVVTQDLILSVRETQNGNDTNWQLKFIEVKLSSSAEAVANYKQYTIYNTSS